MVTTIQVQESTLQLMKKIKNDLKVSTYDEVINKLMELKRKIPKSKFGAHPEMSEFTIEDESEFHDL
jgi:hypothetical protein